MILTLLILVLSAPSAHASPLSRESFEAISSVMNNSTNEEFAVHLNLLHHKTQSVIKALNGAIDALEKEMASDGYWKDLVDFKFFKTMSKKREIYNMLSEIFDTTIAESLTLIIGSLQNSLSDPISDHWQGKIIKNLNSVKDILTDHRKGLNYRMENLKKSQGTQYHNNFLIYLKELRESLISIQDALNL